MAETARSIGEELPDVDFRGVLRILPHRYPMLLVDRVVRIRAYQSAVGIKNVTFNEPSFVGHFPGDPIMPGVMIVEAMAQASAIMAISSMGEHAEGCPIYFMGIDETRFRRPVRPGDQLELEVAVVRHRVSVWRFEGKARVAGELVAGALMTAKVMLREER
jgi:3-hydroxyacyl-[acyl-carrier-protein] dehydratase